MKIILNTKELLCLDYSKKFKNTWEYYCISKDAFLAGYEAAKNVLLMNIGDEELRMIIKESGEVKIHEVELNNGEHQIGAKLTDATNQ